MVVEKSVARLFGMNANTWRRHANPWSVTTRFAAIPLMLLAVWSRAWLGWWALVPVVLVIAWLFINPIAFAPVSVPKSWAAKGIFGERLWVQDRAGVARAHRVILGWLIAAGLAGFALMAWGLVILDLWPVIFGMVLTIMAQLWRIDRMGILYDERVRVGGAHLPDDVRR